MPLAASGQRCHDGEVPFFLRCRTSPSYRVLRRWQIVTRNHTSRSVDTERGEGATWTDEQAKRIHQCGRRDRWDRTTMAVGQEEPPAAGRGSVDVSQRGQAHATAPVVDTSTARKTKVNGMKLAEKERQQWNTRRLGSRMAVDAACAASAGGLVAPLITMIDKCVIGIFLEEGRELTDAGLS